jgi:hypothetical protein
MARGEGIARGHSCQRCAEMRLGVCSIGANLVRDEALLRTDWSKPLRGIGLGCMQKEVASSQSLLAMTVNTTLAVQVVFLHNEPWDEVERS